MPRPQLILGGAALGAGRFASVEQFGALRTVLQKHGIKRVDTAALYPSSDRGGSERLLGQVRASSSSSSSSDHDALVVDTKILTTSFTGEGTLTREAIGASVTASRERLGTQPINVLYCHTYDPQTPLAETVDAIAALREQGAMRDLGVSNFGAAQVDAFVAACRDRGVAGPRCFEGLYNALSRNSEAGGLLDAVRRHGMSFVAYSPLAGGFLTGKFSAGIVEGTRFGTPMGQMYKMLYDKPEMHRAIAILEKAAVEVSSNDHSSAIPALAEASLRWLYWHSALGEDDGIIIGGASPEVIDANCTAIQRGPLPETAVKAFEEAWQTVKDVAPKF